VLFGVWILASPCFLFSLTKVHSRQHQGFDFSSHKKNACPVLSPVGVRATRFTYFGFPLRISFLAQQFLFRLHLI
jgi:hypothetical protein